MGAGFGVGQGVMVVAQVEAAVGGDGVQLVVGQMGQEPAGSLQGVEKHVVGVGHLIGAEHCLEARLVEAAVVRHQRQPLD